MLIEILIRYYMARESFGSGGRCPRCGKGPMVTEILLEKCFAAVVVLYLLNV
jgi:hypothetical protein